MSYYNPTKWIDPSDTLVDSIEIKILADKVAESKIKYHGRSYLPQNELELDVKVKGSVETLRLTEWVDRIGRFHLGLTDFNVLYRRGDFKEKNFHTNPNGFKVPPPHHIHFPTKQYPLEGMHTYAYPVKPTYNDTGEDYISSLRLFCDNNNIRLGSVTLPLIKGH